MDRKAFQAVLGERLRCGAEAGAWPNHLAGAGAQPHYLPNDWSKAFCSGAALLISLGNLTGERAASQAHP